jgi:hypothetical protein
MKIARTALALTAGLLVRGFCPAQSTKADDIVAKITENEINLMRKDLRDQKKQIVANLPLTGDEAAKFWPVRRLYSRDDQGK